MPLKMDTIIPIFPFLFSWLEWLYGFTGFLFCGPTFFFSWTVLE